MKCVLRYRRGSLSNQHHNGLKNDIAKSRSNRYIVNKSLNVVEHEQGELRFVRVIESLRVRGTNIRCAEWIINEIA